MSRPYAQVFGPRYATTIATLRRKFSTFVGIDLGGARGKSTAVARLSCAASASQVVDTSDGSRPGRARHGDVIVQEVTTRHLGIDPWHDAVLMEYLGSLGDGVAIAINAPLTVPACLRCQLPACPGKQICVDPAVEWLRTEGAELVEQALESDRDRIAVIPGGSSSPQGNSRPPRQRPRIEPYVHRGAELKLHYERGLLPRDALGLSIGPIAARAAHLRRLLAGMGFELNHNLLEVSPRATVHALFGARKARGYKRDADPWETRVAIIEDLRDMQFAVSSRLSREEVLRNDHCFDALLSGYTAYLWARDGWTMPEGIFTADGWIWAPPEA